LAEGRKSSSCNSETQSDFQATAEVSFMNSPPMCLFTTVKLEIDRVGATKPSFRALETVFGENLVIETRFIAWGYVIGIRRRLHFNSLELRI
jgi:hypothetical protein